jgi:hypothetical protein
MTKSKRGGVASNFGRLAVTTLLLALLMANLSSAPVAQANEGFPTFTYQGIAVDPDDPGRYTSSAKELIFPSLIKAGDYFANPLATYYLYYAPHESPGGIALSYSNSLNGPWTEYSGNPVISNVWSPHYSVSHVSSPHAIWKASEGKLYMYFHGENNVTRLATSTDGLNFTYVKQAVTTSMFSGISEASYARVFSYAIPGRNNSYIMLLMGNNNGTRKIYLAWSSDGQNWTSQPTPLISPSPDEGGQLSSPFYFPWNGKHYVIYHAGSGKMHATEVGANFDQERHAGVFYDDPNIRDAAPFPYVSGSTMYLFFERGPRLDAKIAWATAPLTSSQKYEAESVTATVSSGDSQADFADANLSNGQGNKLTASATGDWINYAVNVNSPGTYNVKIKVKKQDTRAKAQLSIGGVNLGSEYDHYAPSDSYIELNLGNRQFSTAGTYNFRFTVTGKNNASSGYTLGIDYILLTKV